MPNESVQTGVIRLFGLPTDEVTRILRAASRQGCPGLRLLARDGEFAVCIRATAATQQLADGQCHTWMQQLAKSFGPAVYGVGETDLAEATLKILLKEKKLIVATDRTTGEMLGSVLHPLQHSEAVYDFGNQSWGDLGLSRRIEVPTNVEKQYPGDPVQLAAWTADSARRISGADYGLCYFPGKNRAASFVLITDGRGVWLDPVAADANRMAISNHLLDLTRRLAAGLEFPDQVAAFRLGKPAPTVVRPQPDDEEPIAEKPAPAKKAPRAPEPPAEPEEEAPDPELERFTLANLGLGLEKPKARTREAAPVRTPEHMPRKVSDTYEFARQVDHSRPPRSNSYRQNAELRRAAARIYQQGDEDDESNLPDLSAHRRRERKKARWTALWLILVLLCFVGAVAAFLLFLNTHNETPAPSAVGYGTAAFDAEVEAYILQGQSADAAVSGYLAFPGQTGAYLYTAADEADSRAYYAAGAGPDAALANCVVYADDAALADLAQLDELENLQKNSGFTLYLGQSPYVYKVVSVFEWEPEETGDNALDLAQGTGLANYLSYREFVQAIQERTLFTMPVDIDNQDRFATLLVPRQNGKRLAVVGRQVRENEDSSLVPSAITAAGEQEQAEREGDANSEATQSEGSDDSEVSHTAAQLSEKTQTLIAATDAMLAGLTDKAGSGSETKTELTQGGEGELPKSPVSAEALLATATPAPTPEPEETPTPDPTQNAEDEPTEEPTREPEAEPTEEPTEEPKAEQTLTVTMNGQQQELELVNCLAMIVQNELGSGQPAEAYKAQAVAAHCWILSQGGAPSVAGATPGSTVLEAVREVANVLLTYNGNVCFTPYFASASTGTCAAADVWGSDVPYLQAVESPYDKDFASNWNTSGASSGSARFSRENVQLRVEEKLGIDLEGLDPTEWLTILKQNEYGWVTQLQIGQGSGSTTCSGRWLRETLLAGASVDGRSLRSNSFSFEYDADLDCFVFDVYGYGHGCGLPQWGAVGYARNGWDYRDILSHYFPGTTLTEV